MTLALRPPTLALCAGVLAAAAGAAQAAVTYAGMPWLLVVAAAAAVLGVVGTVRPEIGLALLLAGTPFAENSSFAEIRDSPVRLLLLAWTIALAFIFVLRTMSERRRLPVPAMLGSSALLIACALVATLPATDPGSAAGKLLLLVGDVAVFYLVAASLTDRRRVITLTAVLAGAGLFIALHAIAQDATGQTTRVGFITASGDVQFRVASFFPHPNQLGGFLAMVAPLAFALAWLARPRLLRVAVALGGAVIVGAVVLTYSRGALVGLAALSLLFVRRRRAWPLAAVAVVLAMAFAPPGVRERVAGGGSLDSPEISQRLDIWNGALGMFADRPVFGVGLDNFPAAYVAHERTGREFTNDGRSFVPPPTAHNAYLNTLAEQGILGGIALVLLMAAFVRMALVLVRSAERSTRILGLGIAGSGIVLAFHNLFDVTFVDPKTSVVTFAVFGLGAALAGIEQRSGEPERARG